MLTMIVLVNLNSEVDPEEYERWLDEHYERQRLIQLRDEGIIGDDAMHRIEHDLDLEESRLDIG